MIVSLPRDEPERSRAGVALARELVAIAHRAPEGQRGWLVAEINGGPPAEDSSSQFLIDAGFSGSSRGLQLRVPRLKAEIL